jgi:inner membrane protein
LIAISIIGANLPDFDHKIKKDNVYKIIIIGLIIFIVLYTLKLPFYIGIIITLTGFIFYFSNHRGFTHSIWGVILLTILISGFLICSFQLINDFFNISNKELIFVILILLTSAFSLNKKLYLIFIPFFLISLFLFGIKDINFTKIILSLFLGYLSHIVLDSFSPAGIKLFSPISNKKFFKKFGIIVLIIILFLGFLNIYFNLNDFNNIISIIGDRLNNLF